MSKYLQMVPVPSPGSINSGLSPLHQRTVMELIGTPGALTRNCSTVTNAKLKAKIVTRPVAGKDWKITGHQQAVTLFLSILSKVRKADPELFALIQTDGMLCCRAVRGASSFSNHSWGMAWDMQIGPNLVEYGATECQAGLVELYKYMHPAGTYWGAGFGGSRTDAMHWEPSDELVREWHAEGLLV